jgi:hypothetical protein
MRQERPDQQGVGTADGQPPWRHVEWKRTSPGRGDLAERILLPVGPAESAQMVPVDHEEREREPENKTQRTQKAHHQGVHAN